MSEWKRRISKFSISFLALSLCLFSLKTSTAATSDTISGDGYTTQKGTLYNGNFSDPSSAAAVSNFSIYAMTSGTSSSIKYDVEISFGDMQFVYDYGNYWNPTTHSYMANTTGRQGGGWVIIGYTDGTPTVTQSVNNLISIENYSNFPMTCSLSYSMNGTQLNADPYGEHSVIGIFQDGFGFTDYSLLEEGYGGATARNMQTMSFTLEMDSSGINTAGEYYYYVNSEGDTNKDIYFALSGIPDRDGPSDFTKVGTITVNIAPAVNTTKMTIMN